MLEPFLERLATAVQDGNGWEEITSRLISVAAEDETETARPFVYAFGYWLIDADEEERRQIAGAPFGPMLDFGGEQFPPPLAEVSGGIVAVWADYVTATDHPAALSRLHDLLWERRDGVPHEHARAAITAYLTLAVGEWEPITRVSCAGRALELARAINDADGVAAAAQACIELAEAMIATDERVGGVALRALIPLVKLPASIRPDRLVDVVRAARERYESDFPWLKQSLTSLLAGLVEPGESETLWRIEVSDWRHLAKVSTGALRYEHLQHALQLALSHGFTDLTDAIRREIESMIPDEFDFKTISVEGEIPAEEIDKLIDWVAAAGDWQGVLRRLGAQGPPSGQVAANEAAVRSAGQRFPAMALFGEQLIGPHMALVFRADTPERKFRLEMAKQESYGVGVFGLVLIRILERLVADLGEPSEDQLTDTLSSNLIDAGLARQCARAFGCYWRADYDALGHLLAPRIEAVVRLLCLALGVQVSKLPSGERPGGVVSLGELLRGLEGLLDESWRRYLCHTLTDQLGLDLRNRICHGLIDEVSQAHAALLIHVTLFLAILDVQPAELEQTLLEPTG